MGKYKRSQRVMPYDYTRNMRNESSLISPIRQTASIFKQPVTAIKSQSNSKVNTDLKTYGNQSEKPKQLFWEKRLERLWTSNVVKEENQNFKLPVKMSGVGPHMHRETLIRSIVSALYTNTQPITGQIIKKEDLEKDPALYLNREQPLINTTLISDEDIKRQELKVQSIREKMGKTLNECKN